VFNADSEEHAKRIAKSEVGGALRDVPWRSSRSSRRTATRRTRSRPNIY